jgi:hypothetical protein
MTDDAQPVPSKHEHRVQAGVAFFRREPGAQVSTQDQPCRGDRMSASRDEGTDTATRTLPRKRRESITGPMAR